MNIDEGVERNAELGARVPRVLMKSQLARTGTTIEILRPRIREANPLERLLARRVPPSRRYERYPLDRRASRIWCLIDNERTVDELIDAYLHHYPDDRLQIGPRICRLLATLADHGFIEIVEG